MRCMALHRDGVVITDSMDGHVPVLLAPESNTLCVTIALLEATLKCYLPNERAFLESGPTC